MAEEGFLKSQGYCVGRGGIRSAAERCRILDRCFGMTVPDWVEDREKWGGPESRERVQKMLHCLKYWAYLRGQRHDSEHDREAAADWEEDARYLQSKYSRILNPHLRMDEQGRVIGFRGQPPP